MKNPNDPRERHDLGPVGIAALVVIVGALAVLTISACLKVRRTSQDHAVMGNVRNLGAAADQYFLDHRTSTASAGALRAYYPGPVPVDGEVYPTDYTMSVPITVTNIAGSRPARSLSPIRKNLLTTGSCPFDEAAQSRSLLRSRKEFVCLPRMNGPDTDQRRGNLTWVEIVFVSTLCVLAGLGFLAYRKVRGVRNTSQDKAVLSNIRQLGAAADQYFLEHSTSTAGIGDLVGSNTYIRSLSIFADEAYPAAYTQNVAITVTGIRDSCTITYLQ